MPGIWKREKNERGSVFAFMETTRKLSRREKLALIGKYLRPLLGALCGGAAVRVPGMVFNALTPQIIRLTVDSILGPETPKLPGFLMSWLNWAALEAQPLRALWWAAASRPSDGPAAGRVQLWPAAPAGPGIRELCQGYPGRPVPPHPVSALCLAQK